MASFVFLNIEVPRGRHGNGQGLGRKKYDDCERLEPILRALGTRTVFCSPEDTAAVAGRVVADALDLEPLRMDEIRPRMMGQMEGMDSAQIESKIGGFERRYWSGDPSIRGHGVEDQRQLINRVKAAWKKGLETGLEASVLYVTHLDVIRGILSVMEATSPESTSEFELGDTHMLVYTRNDDGNFTPYVFGGAA